MNFFKRLLGKKPNPTENWSKANIPIPDLDADQMRFGELTFGDSIKSAEFLGCPDSVEWLNENYLKLIYSSHGFQLDFEGDRLNYIAYFIGPDACDPESVNLEYSSPGVLLRGLRHVLGQQDGVESVEAIWGPASSVDADDDETILCYKDGSVNMEFELTPNGRSLKRWNIYIDPSN